MPRACIPTLISLLKARAVGGQRVALLSTQREDVLLRGFQRRKFRIDLHAALGQLPGQDAVLARQFLDCREALLDVGLARAVEVQPFRIMAQFARRFGDADRGFLQQGCELRQGRVNVLQRFEQRL
jgi:outer membrane scaffolding protein for murein synthesis (MipA/OmpV family)